MDFKHIEELSENNIIELYKNIIENNTILSCICYCNGKNVGDVINGKSCGIGDSSFSPTCLYDCRNKCQNFNAYNCGCTFYYNDVFGGYSDPQCYT